MSINYVLHPNRLTEDPNDYIARVHSSGNVSFDEIVQRIILLGSTVVKSDIYSVFEDFNTAIESFMLDGKTVTLPLVNFKVSIKGTFDGASDSFDSSRHEVVASASPGPRLKKTISQQMTVIKQDSSKLSPLLDDFINHVTKEKNSTIAPADSNEIFGSNLKFDNSDPQQGVFFIAEDETETRVTTVAMNTAKKLIFTAPPLAPGNYTVAVRALFNDKELRTGQHEKTLVVS